MYTDHILLWRFLSTFIAYMVFSTIFCYVSKSSSDQYILKISTQIKKEIKGSRIRVTSKVPNL